MPRDVVYFLQRQPQRCNGWTVHWGAWCRHLCLCPRPASTSAPVSAFIPAGAPRASPAPWLQLRGISLVCSVHQLQLFPQSDDARAWVPGLARRAPPLSWPKAREPFLKGVWGGVLTACFHCCCLASARRMSPARRTLQASSQPYCVHCLV